MSGSWSIEGIAIADHPLLDARGFVVALPAPIAQIPGDVDAFAAASAAALQAQGGGDAVAKAARDLLRWGGYKPTGRGKPASEFLKNIAQTEGMPRINPVIDACNQVSMRSGWPISAVDADKLTAPLQIRLGQPGERYPFNASGHEIDVEGLLCLCDAAGPCANGVKDAQRSKTDGDTTRLLVVIWASRSAPGLGEATAAWLAEALTALGARVTPA